MAQPTPRNGPEPPVRYIPTKEAYDRWAEVYDTDGNFLQAMDDIEMKKLFPRFLDSIATPKPWRIVDLGCGTGRNTALLLGVPKTEVIALDASKGMLAVAKTRLNPSADLPSLRFEVFDMLVSPEPPQSILPHTVDAVVSTLVVEHVPLKTFFRHVSHLLRPGGILLLTNMHSHMGGISQAGFIDKTTGEKIRPTSYAHTTHDIISEAWKFGLEVRGHEGSLGLLERAVDESMVEDLGLRSRKWVEVTCWVGGLFQMTTKQED
ncbi:putative methyltransferase [Xylariaceae sp. FL0255]|nr:putative methyltransferase [Xylariaceae sp. FL0255]